MVPPSELVSKARIVELGDGATLNTAVRVALTRSAALTPVIIPVPLGPPKFSLSPFAKVDPFHCNTRGVAVVRETFGCVNADISEA